MSGVVIVGRSSSHFTRVPRVIAHALGVPYTLEVVRDLRSVAPADYAGNPGLKIPALRADGDVVFGAVPCARRIATIAGGVHCVAWPEDAGAVLLQNAHEVAWTAMSTQVQLGVAVVFHGMPRAHPLVDRLERSLGGALGWLDAHAAQALAALPADRTLSLFEVALVCLVEHVAFRQTLDLAAYPRLRTLVTSIGAQPACVETRFAFDAV